MNSIDLEKRQELFQSNVNRVIDILPETSSTHKQLSNYQEMFKDSISYLLDKNHRLAFIGNIGTGKTTAICHMLGLIDDKEPILSTGSGRTTLCEVDILYGDCLRVEVTPYSELEVHSYLNDLSLYLSELVNKRSRSDSTETFKLSAEIERALRNMLDLKVTRSRNKEGKRITHDAAKEFSENYSDHKKLTEALINRINLKERKKTIFLNDNNEKQNKWLHDTFKSVNSATHPNVGLAKRITITVPQPLFDGLDYSLKVVDTKGVDQTVNRQDLDNCFTDNRTISVICCRFNDAPDKTMASLLKNAKEAGLSNRLAEETVLLILDRDNEAAEVIDIDEAVGDKSEGREIRSDHIESDLRHSIQVDAIDITFLDAKNDDITAIQQMLPIKVSALRDVHGNRLDEIEIAVSAIKMELESQTALQAKKQIKSTLEPWLRKALIRTPSLKEYFLPLINDIADKGTYAASVRASINRKGEWHNLDYYQNLASGARMQVVEQVDGLKNELIVLIDNMLSQNELQPAYALLKQLKHTTEKRLGDMYQQVFAKGRAVYEEELHADTLLWNKLAQEWGAGPGYKDRIGRGSEQWFQHKKYPNFEAQVTQQAKDQWHRYVDEVQQLLGADI
jgi:energy-coupling factor transporter ATP-binding protein EcfA2